MAAIMDPSIDYCTIPAAVPPSGVFNFVDPPILGPAVISVGVVLAVISTTFTLGRLFINRSKLHSADYFTIIGCLWNIAYTGVILAQHRYYRHSWDTPVCWYNGTYLKLPFVQTMIFCPVFLFTKCAIFLLYRQLFGVERRFRAAIYFGLVVTILTYLSEIPLAAIYAAPRAGQSWDDLLLTLWEGSKSFAIGGTVQSAIGTVLDFYIFFLPLPILMKLHLPARKRWQLIGLFSTAFLGIAASIASLVCKIKIISSNDSNWLAAITSMCTLIETNIALIVGCMPAFAQFVTVHIGGSTLFKSLRSRLMGTSRGSAGSVKTGPDDNAPTLHTIGGGSNRQQMARRKNYYELTDTLLNDTKATVTDVHGSQLSVTDQMSKPGSSQGGRDSFA